MTLQEVLTVLKANKKLVIGVIIALVTTIVLVYYNKYKCKEVPKTASDSASASDSDNVDADDKDKSQHMSHLNKNIILKPSYMILFTSETCGHCVNFQPTWDKLKEKYNNTGKGVHLTEFTYQNNLSEFKKNNIDRTPTIGYLPSNMDGASGTIETKDIYNGPMTFKDISKFIDNKL